MDFTELRHLAEQIETECGKAIIGKGEQIRLVCLLYTSDAADE